MSGILFHAKTNQKYRNMFITAPFTMNYGTSMQWNSMQSLSNASKYLRNKMMSDVCKTTEEAAPRPRPSIETLKNQQKL